MYIKLNMKKFDFFNIPKSPKTVIFPVEIRHIVIKNTLDLEQIPDITEMLLFETTSFSIDTN